MMKSFWKSWTIWFNSVVGTVAVLLPELLSQLPVLKEYLPTDLYRWLFLIVMIGNIGLRFKTNTGVTVANVRA